jgi:hypothetical protein
MPGAAVRGCTIAPTGIPGGASGDRSARGPWPQPGILASSLERPEVGAVMVIEVQKDDHLTLNHVDDHPIANVGAHHASQVMDKPLINEWVIADIGELIIDAIPQKHDPS